MKNTFNTFELTHYGVKGMKWGVRKKLVNVVSDKIKKKSEVNSERFKDRLASSNPIAKKHMEAAKERQKKQAEMHEITQAKGKSKVAKILAKIGKDLVNPVIIDAPRGPQRQPWDEKPTKNPGGRI